MAYSLLPSVLLNKKRKDVVIPIIQDKLYWVCGSQPPKNSSNSIYFCIDEVNLDFDLFDEGERTFIEVGFIHFYLTVNFYIKELIYEPLRNDFGPFCIENTLNFIKNVKGLLENPEYASTKIYHYTSSSNAEKKVNSAFLICAYQLLCLNRTSTEIWQNFKDIDFITFRDASDIKSDYRCTLLDCLRGLEYAFKLNWVSINNFNIQQHQELKQFDITVIIPNKLIAFQNPEIFTTSDNSGELTVDQSIQIFKQMGVKLVIRLNNSNYSSQLYERNGIKHRDLIFPDGSQPTEDIMHEFLKEVESVDGMVAVHCKAGRGRTGTLIGCYAMKHYHFPAKDFIGYIRIMRPGCIHGPQQPFLNCVERNLIEVHGQNSEIWSSVKHLVENENENVKSHSASILYVNEKKRQNQEKPRNRGRSLVIQKQNSLSQQQSVEQTPLKNSKTSNKGSILYEMSTASSAVSGGSGVKTSDDCDQVKDFYQISEKYMISPLSNIVRNQSRNQRHLRNISAYQPKNESNSYMNTSSSIIQSEVQSMNNLPVSKGTQNSLENGKRRKLVIAQNTRSKRFSVGRQPQEDERNSSLNSFYGLDIEDSQQQAFQQLKSIQNNIQQKQINENDIIFNNLCNLYNKHQTKAQEKFNKTQFNNTPLEKSLISRKNYIIKQHNKPLAQIY